jgi:putative N-acetylmannosamine-6-phosphate epimerase
MDIIKRGGSIMERALLTLTSSEAKRLVGKGIANLPEVQKAFKDGFVFVATSTLTGYVAEELLNKPIDKGFSTRVSRGSRR